MTDKQILDEVYRRLIDEKQKYNTALPSPIISFIEQEWQKHDELEVQRADTFNLADDGQKYITVDDAGVNLKTGKFNGPSK